MTEGLKLPCKQHQHRGLVKEGLAALGHHTQNSNSSNWIELTVLQQRSTATWQGSATRVQSYAIEVCWTAAEVCWTAAEALLLQI